jgi:hypothetical protein
MKPVPFGSNITELNGCHFEYVYIRVQPITEDESRLLVEIKSSDGNSRDMMISYLSEFSNLQQVIEKDHR